MGTGARKETVTAVSVGAAGPTGGGIDLAAPLRFDHAAGIDVSDVGTGITFTPATKFPHTSGDAVQAQGSGITLDRPLARSHPHGAPVSNPIDTTTGYQGAATPRQWFGGTLAAGAGSLALVDATGALVVDAVVYGSQQSSSSANGAITSPEIATLEGDQGKGGCIAVVPPVGRGGGPPAAGAGDKSIGRFPDGGDMDSNCADFQTQTAATLSTAASAGVTNIKVAGVAGFTIGQTITIDTGANLEQAAIATVGTAGAATVSASTSAGATTITLAGVGGFIAGQAVIVDSGANSETTTVTSSTGGGRGGAPITLTVTTPLAFAHAAGAQVSGTGLTLASALSRAHAAGAQVAGNVPTPGAPNQYQKRRQ